MEFGASFQQRVWASRAGAERRRQGPALKEAQSQAYWLRGPGMVPSWCPCLCPCSVVSAWTPQPVAKPLPWDVQQAWVSFCLAQHGHSAPRG